ncbi:NADP-dependent oxidoreductase domain-containing protein [Immersiella caudata]|uniref:NADP-dependent oxidoreductase domain-containing protein n=1 Tax=Immersiella caudata TaxID=314043 RepID=A0AA39WE51_9PEZI|nr:NADP-dependent oxidoreductase domain-containing protein [Immersiella caudata]
MSSSNAIAHHTINGKPIGRVGFGMLGLTKPWAPVDYSIAIQVMKTALEQGANFWNGAIHYGTPTANSLHLLHHYFTLHPTDAPKITLSIKGAYSMQSGPTGSPSAIRASVENALQVLKGVKTIDIFELARVDPNVPIETCIMALAELVKEGKIGGIGLSEVSAATVRRANAVHPINVIGNGVLGVCRELDIPVVAYSPVGRGFLTGELRSVDDLPANDFRRMLPRFQPGAFEQNFKLVEAVEEIAKRKGVTTAQVAIGWVCRQGAIPIPESTRVERVVENCRPAELTDEEMIEIKRVLDAFPVSGQRYGGVHEKFLSA